MGPTPQFLCTGRWLCQSQQEIWEGEHPSLGTRTEEIGWCFPLLSLFVLPLSSFSLTHARARTHTLVLKSAHTHRWSLDRDPLCFVWLALSEATAENGAVEVVRGSHKLGILTQRGHTLTPEHVAKYVDGCEAGDRVQVVLKPGQAFLCHNWTVHRSGVNATLTARRGFS